MGADAPPGMQHALGGFAVTVNEQDPAKVEKIFNALTQGGSINMPLQQTFWALKFGMLVDKFGVPWMVNCVQECAA